MKEDYLSTARKRTDPILIEALARMSSINTEKANQYRILLSRINSEAKAPTKMLKIVRDFIREEQDFSLKFQNALLKPIFTAIEEENESLKSKFEKDYAINHLKMEFLQVKLDQERN